MINMDQQDTRIANLLTDYVDGVAPLDALMRQYQLSYSQVIELIDLTDQLRSSMVKVDPSVVFVDRLYEDLMNTPEGRTWRQRLPALPVRRNQVMIAASIGGLTLALITARSVSNWLAVRHQDEPSQEALA